MLLFAFAPLDGSVSFLLTPMSRVQRVKSVIGTAHQSRVHLCRVCEDIRTFCSNSTMKLRRVSGRLRHISSLLHHRRCLESRTRRGYATSGVTPMFRDSVDAAALARHLRGRLVTCRRVAPPVCGVTSSHVPRSAAHIRRSCQRWRLRQTDLKCVIRAEKRSVASTAIGVIRTPGARLLLVRMLCCRIFLMKSLRSH